MKTLPFHHDEKKQRVTVECADGEVSVYRSCSFCRHCVGIRSRERVAPNPQLQALTDIRARRAGDEALMQAAMMFNTLVRGGEAIECDDDGNQGFSSLYSR